MTSVVRWVEVHRLAVAGREAGIARDVGYKCKQQCASSVAEPAAGAPPLH
jgi:hypothetical protein